jgi:hypothetical protein
MSLLFQHGYPKCKVTYGLNNKFVDGNFWGARKTSVAPQASCHAPRPHTYTPNLCTFDSHPLKKIVEHLLFVNHVMDNDIICKPIIDLMCMKRRDHHILFMRGYKM